MNQTSGIRVEGGLKSALIVDDHPLFCDALSMTLSAAVGFDTVETVGRLDEAMDHLDGAPAPDVIILDLNLPDVNGLDGLVRLRNMVPTTPIVVVSSMSEPMLIRSVIRVGAAGYVPKHSSREVFREAFDHIAKGAVFAPEGALPEGDLRNLPPSQSEEALIRLSHLTRQQAKILQLICAGKMNKQIAYELTIAETTVKAHVTAIMRKLGVQSRTQAVLMAMEANFDNLLPDT
ncbi:Transcriptional regulatory protein DegU [Aquimixticola soesokkakensis]|uniref:Transcriptional regulatory protein DegU n=1 Tax=Aquimixticola soesokkakensis TaxID=1519096 RepID=A0A1Y5RTU3_9RHOB|nr:response regulator transcription factor [Aquimixticola soesokkakensis]SLN25411.1 Transcriptional regulatory protein DegU [Aquimixticola soesokkakensis]